MKLLFLFSQIFIHYEVGIKVGNFLCDVKMCLIMCDVQEDPCITAIYMHLNEFKFLFQNNTLDFSHSVSKI